MTTTCLPCELAATEAVVEEVPDIDPKKAARWSGPIGIENQRTGDGRLIESNALRWDTLPIPLRWAMQDFGAHDGAYVVGKIEDIERIDYQEANKRLLATDRDALPESFADAIIIWGEGEHDLGSEHGREAFRQTDEGLTPGISMDLDDIVVRDEGEDTFTITEGRVRAATQVAIPAFEGARIAVSDVGKEAFTDADLAADDEVFNWVEDAGGLPTYIERIKKHLEKKGMETSHAVATAVNVVKKMCSTGDVNFPGAQQVNAGSRAEACAAVADWEAKKAKAHADAAVTITASAASVFPHEWFADPHLHQPTPLTVTKDGQVYGHIAIWGTCHIASPQGKHVCTQPPRSHSNYAYFNTHSVDTDAGEIPVGRLTMNTLHAGARLGSNDTIYHYEHTGAVGAYVVAGDDGVGIWVAGAARPDADITTLKASPVSGDWRRIGGNLELVGVLSVNVPGFPVPRPEALVASGEVQSLVASGMVSQTMTAETITLTDETVLLLRDRFRALDRKEQAEALAAKVNRLASLERVRRVMKIVGPGTFAYNPDQWRMPKGNPDAGQWIDMPDVALDGLGVAIANLGTSPSADQSVVQTMQGDFDSALDAASVSADALRNNDDQTAQDAAEQAQGALDQVQSGLDSLTDSEGIGPSGITEAQDALTEAQDSLGRITDADLSLLGDTGFEGDDIGAEDSSTPFAPDKALTDAGYTEIGENSGFQGPAYEDPTGNFIIAQRDDGSWEVYDDSGETNGEVYDNPADAVKDVSAAVSEGQANALNEDGNSPGFQGEAVNAQNNSVNAALPDTAATLTMKDHYEDMLVPWSSYYREVGAYPPVSPPDSYVQKYTPEAGAYDISLIQNARLRTTDPRTLQYLDEQEAVIRKAFGGRLPDGSGSYVKANERATVKGFEDMRTPEDTNVTARYKDPDGWTWTRVAVQGGSGDWRITGPNNEYVTGGYDSGKIAKVKAAVAKAKQDIADGNLDDVEAVYAGKIVPASWGVPETDAEGKSTFTLPGGVTVTADKYGQRIAYDVGGNEIANGWGAAFREELNKALSLRGSGSFAYNKDQWRVPKGNPDAGQWIDMPDVGVTDLADSLQSMAESADLNDAEATMLGDSIDKAQTASKAASDALRNNDGEGATKAAAEADAALQEISDQLMNHADNGTIDEAAASDLGAKLEAAQSSVDTVKDSDLSLLGDTGIGGDEAGGVNEKKADSADIGAEDPTVGPTGLPEKKRGNADTYKVPSSEPLDPTSLPSKTAEALDLQDDEYVYDSEQWPGMYDVVDGDLNLINVADKDGNVVGSSSGGGNKPIIYNYDGSNDPETYDTIEEAADALQKRNGDGGGAPGKGTPATSAGGSEQQKAGNSAVLAANHLADEIGAAAEAELPEEDAPAIGDALDSLQVLLDKLNAGIQDGNYNAADLAAAKNSLVQMESLLMASADKPGLSDQTANQIGVALDDLFAKMASLESLLQGETAPPPFAARKYVRQWLGRRGIRLGTFARV